MIPEGTVVALTSFDQKDRTVSGGSAKTSETSGTTISTLTSCLETRANELPSDDELKQVVSRLHHKILEPIPENGFVDAAMLRRSLKEAIVCLDLFVARPEPEEHSRLKGAIQDVAECLNVKQNSDDRGDVADLPDWYARGEKAIRDCTSLDQFKTVYVIHVVPAMGRLLKAQGSDDPETWALQWASRMRLGGNRQDWALNWSRKLCLEIVYKIYDWCGRTKLRKESLIVRLQAAYEGFGFEKLEHILHCALYMERAHTLYVMKYPGASSVGMHWVAKQHVASDTKWKQLLRDAGGMPTINKRLINLNGLKGHDFGEWLNKVLEPCSIGAKVPSTVIKCSRELSSALIKSCQFGYLLESESDFTSVLINSSTMTQISFRDVLKQTTSAIAYLEMIGVNLLPTKDHLTPFDDYCEGYFDTAVWEALVKYNGALSQWINCTEIRTIVPFVDVQSDSEMIYNVLDRLLTTKRERVPSLKMNLTSWVLATVMTAQLAMVCLIAADLACGGPPFPVLIATRLKF